MVPSRQLYTPDMTCAFAPCTDVSSCALPGGCIPRRFGQPPRPKARRKGRRTKESDRALFACLGNVDGEEGPRSAGDLGQG
jgi:hypothetical protein